MSKTTTKGSETQGVREPETNGQEVNKENVRKWLKKDLSSAIMLFNSIHGDDALLDVISDFMYGRFLNQQNHKNNPPKPE